MTPTQQVLLRFIGDYQTAHGGMSPSVDQMRQHVGLKAKSNIKRYLDILERDGHLTRTKGTPRTILLTGKCPSCGRAA